MAREPTQLPRQAAAFPKWTIAAVAGILVLAALGVFVWRSLHKQRPPAMAPSATNITAWPAQPTNIPQTDAERQRALEAQLQQEKSEATEPAPTAAVSEPAQTPSEEAATTKSTQPSTAPVKPPAEVAAAPAPIAPPPPAALSYDDKLKQAKALAGSGDYTQAQTVLTSAVQVDPSDWRAYNELGKLALYRRNDPAHAFEYYRSALAKGGQATLRVSLEHGTGWLSIQKGKAALKDATGARSFDMADVQEAKRNKTGIVRLGKGHQAFHIRLASGDNYNLEPSSYDPAEEVDFILATIGK
jgi:tetratricopeptide (TPR) repeat protein